MPSRESKLNAFMKSHLCMLLLASVILTGCANTPEAKIERVRKYVSKRPFNEWPAIYEQLERKGDITPLVRKQWTDAWGIEKKKQEVARIAYEKEQKRQAAEAKRIWDSLTPAQKMDYTLRQQQIAQQQAYMLYQAEAQRRANVSAAISNFQQSMQNQQMINAYQQRTQVLSQPVDVNLNGNINHNLYTW